MIACQRTGGEYVSSRTMMLYREAFGCSYTGLCLYPSDRSDIDWINIFMFCLCAYLRIQSNTLCACK